MPHPEDNMAVFPGANAHVTAIGVMTTPLAAITIAIAVALMNGGAALTGPNDDFCASRQCAHYRRGNCSAQNKQTHFSAPLYPSDKEQRGTCEMVRILLAWRAKPNDQPFRQRYFSALMLHIPGMALSQPVYASISSILRCAISVEWPQLSC
jgi:hypothetical protein